ncbi:hypothetical protein DFH07DRAFT_807399 [Mycena maculata]|uniref:Uncharacterized protein n=1 Tax=Mycena maculata TaxID=230809 RepID=A0AAD7NPB3_9AGAR|nr:hypothetical protein DFH07DRAFT_807399 [Mycena maculata]
MAPRIFTSFLPSLIMPPPVPPPGPSQSASSAGVTIGATLGAIVLFSLMLAIAFFLLRRRMNRKMPERRWDPDLVFSPTASRDTGRAKESSDSGPSLRREEHSTSQTPLLSSSPTSDSLISRLAIPLSAPGVGSSAFDHQVDSEAHSSYSEHSTSSAGSSSTKLYAGPATSTAGQPPTHRYGIPTSEITAARPQALITNPRLHLSVHPTSGIHFISEAVRTPMNAVMELPSPSIFVPAQAVESIREPDIHRASLGSMVSEDLESFVATFPPPASTSEGSSHVGRGSEENRTATQSSDSHVSPLRIRKGGIKEIRSGRDV